MKILVTGAAGFIGYHVCERLLALGHDVTGLDNINDYYDVNLKYARLANLGFGRTLPYGEGIESTRFGGRMKFYRMNLEDTAALPDVFASGKFDAVCNLAAQAGVRYSLEKPFTYIESNINGFLNILECCRHHNVGHLVYASSSSVYGSNEKVPFSVEDTVDHPISLYAASKKANELMAYTYGHLFGIKTIGLRFFTVYGPWGRPDMALFLFTSAIFEGRPINVFNNGDMSRDFTYIDDIVDGVCATLLQESKDQDKSQLYNIGNSSPVKLLDFIDEIEKNTGRTATKNMMPMQPGDVPRTWADVSALTENFGYHPDTPISEGVRNFVDWYKSYYNVQ